ncbi:MAG: tyrosine-type recombinase/integrase [Hyphomicrobiaceae bacterium]
MGKIVSPADRRNQSRVQLAAPDATSLYAASRFATAERKYLNREERQRVLTAIDHLPMRPALFALTLAWSGARISEVLALTPLSFQIESSLIAIVTLKRRRWCVREVPIPPTLMQMLALEFGLAGAQGDQTVSGEPLWSMSRTTAWRVVKRVMAHAGISGRGACPRGLRHSFGVGTLQAGVPITLLQRWLGHARLSTTEIYTKVIGPEEIAFARLFWKSDVASG